MTERTPDELPERYVDGKDGSPADAAFRRALLGLRESPVPPSGRERLARMVPGARRPSRQAVWWSAGVLAAGAAAALAIRLGGGASDPVPEVPPEIFTLVVSSGDVSVGRQDGSFVPAAAGRRLASGSRVRTGRSSRAVVRFEDAAATTGE